MHTSRDGRPARRTKGTQARRGGGVGRRLAVAVPMFVFASMALVALFGLVVAVGVFAVYSQGLSDPRQLENLEFISESIVYDRSGSVELARFNAGERRQPVTYEQIPPILIDATTAIEDRSFWTNTGVDPLGIMSAMFDTIRGKRTRRLDDHPAAGSSAAARSRAGARSGTGDRAQDQGDHPVGARD